VRFIGTSVQAPADSHTAPITSLEWSPDGQFLASGSYDGSVLIWERNGWRAKHRLFHPRLVNGVRWSPNGTWLATSCADGHCRVWNSESGIETHVLSRHTDDVNSVAWSPDSNNIVTVSDDGTGRLWSLTSSQLLGSIFAHSDDCMSVDWQPTGAMIATCGEDPIVRLWPVLSGTFKSLEIGHSLGSVRWSPLGDLLAVTCDDCVTRIIDASGEEVLRLGPHNGPVKAAAWRSDGLQLATGAYDGTVKVWSLPSGSEVACFYDQRMWPRALHWNSDGTLLAVGSQGGRPIILNITKDRPSSKAEITRRLNPEDRPTQGVNCVSASRGAIVCGLDDGSLRRIVLATGHTSSVHTTGRSLINAVAAKNGTAALGDFSGHVDLVQLSEQRFGQRAALGAPVNGLAWAPDSFDRLAAVDYSGSLSILSSKSELGLEVEIRERVCEAATKDVEWVSPKMLAVAATDGNVYLVDNHVAVCGVLRGHGNLVNAVAVCSQRPFLASASRDRTVRVWDIDSKRCLRVLVGHEESVKSVVWSPHNPNLLASGGYDFDVRVWDLSKRPGEDGYCKILAWHRQGVSSLAWCEANLVSVSWDGSVAIWDVANSAPSRTITFAEI